MSKPDAAPLSSALKGLVFWAVVCRICGDTVASGPNLSNTQYFEFADITVRDGTSK